MRRALEALASGPAMAREGMAALARIGRTVPDGLTARHVFDAAQAGEPWAIETRDHCVAQLGRGIAAAVCAYDVERVVVGGGVASAGDGLFVPLRVAVARHLPYFMPPSIGIVAAQLGDQAPMV